MRTMFEIVGTTQSICNHFSLRNDIEGKLVTVAALLGLLEHNLIKRRMIILFGDWNR